MESIKTFHPQKVQTRFYYVRASILVIGGLTLVYLILNFMYSVSIDLNSQNPLLNDRVMHSTNSSILIITEAILCLLLLTWVFTRKIVTEISIDFFNRKFIVERLTVFNKKNKIEVPSENLSFSFEEMPIYHHPWSLKVYNRDKRVFSIETRWWGFSQETLEEIVDNLEALV